MKTTLLIACHVKADLEKNEVFLPIAVGKKGEWANGMLRDDDGENIADKNAVYNELTAVYYAWKNYEKLGDPDVIGLNHYRRFFIYEQRKYAYYETKDHADLLQKIAFDEKKFAGIFSEYDFVAPTPNVRRSVRKNYLDAHGGDDLDRALRIVARDYPDYLAAANEYVENKATYFYNAFLFKKADFFRYCDFLFGVLFSLEKDRTSSDRLFVSEVLTGIFFTQLKKEGKKEFRLPVLFVGKKPTFSQSLVQTKRNFSADGSLLYKLKPLLTFFVPDSLLLLRKRRPAK